MLLNLFRDNVDCIWCQILILGLTKWCNVFMHDLLVLELNLTEKTNCHNSSIEMWDR